MTAAPTVCVSPAPSRTTCTQYVSWTKLFSPTLSPSSFTFSPLRTPVKEELGLNKDKDTPTERKPFGLVSPVVVTYHQESPCRHGPGCAPKGEIEVDPLRLSARQKQIDYGKATPEYKTYVAPFSKCKRPQNLPSTPEITRRCAKRCFEAQVRRWRRSLHRLEDQAREDRGEVPSPSPHIGNTNEKIRSYSSRIGHIPKLQQQQQQQLSQQLGQTRLLVPQMQNNLLSSLHIPQADVCSSVHYQHQHQHQHLGSTQAVHFQQQQYPFSPYPRQAPHQQQHHHQHQHTHQQLDTKYWHHLQNSGVSLSNMYQQPMGGDKENFPPSFPPTSFQQGPYYVNYQQF